MSKGQIIVYSISFILIVIAVGILISWHIENTQTTKITEELKRNVIFVSVPNDPKKIEIVNPPSIDTPQAQEYEALVEEPLLDTTIEDFLDENPDTVGWISIDGTNIDYPIVQTTDNEYYLTHSFDNSYNSSGWIFADYRNNMKDFDKNTIIYGHNRLNNTMFADLKTVLTNNWYTTSSWGIDLITMDKDTKWQIVSVYRVPAETYYLTTTFDNDLAYSEFLNTIIERSEFDFSAFLNTKDKILTLSTCTNINNGRIVVHAKLVKTQPRKK